MEMMTLTKEQRELKAMAPATAQAAGARVRELTPAQRRAVMFAQQQVLRARAAKKAKDERQAALTRGRGLRSGTHACCAARSGTAR